MFLGIRAYWERPRSMVSSVPTQLLADGLRVTALTVFLGNHDSGAAFPGLCPFGSPGCVSLVYLFIPLVFPFPRLKIWYRVGVVVGDPQANFLLLFKIPNPWQWGKYSSNSEAIPSTWKMSVVSKKLLIMVIVVPFFKSVFLFDKMTFYYF